MENIGQRLNLLANAAVLVGIAFVAYELRQNNVMMQAQTRDSMTEKQMMITEWMVSDPEMASVFVRGRVCDLELGTREYWMYLFFMVGVFRDWENSLYQYEMGLYEPEEFEPRLNRWRGALTEPGIRSIWDRNKSTYSPQLQAVVADLLEGLQDSSLCDWRTPDAT